MFMVSLVNGQSSYDNTQDREEFVIVIAAAAVAAAVDGPTGIWGAFL